MKTVGGILVHHWFDLAGTGVRVATRSSMGESPGVDVPPPPPGTRPSPPTSSEPSPAPIPTSTGKNFRVVLVVGGLILALFVVGAIVNNRGSTVNDRDSTSCVDWRAVSTHLGAAQAAGEARDVQAMIYETRAASAAATSDVTLSSDLNRAAEWMRAGDFQHALADLEEAGGDIQASSMPQC